MTKFLISLLVGVVWFLPTIGFCQQLKVATSEWPPYSGKDLPKQGLAVDIVDTALRRAGYEPMIKIESWPRTLQGVNVGVYDVIAAAWYTDERAEAFTFSKPYLYNQIKFITLKNSSFTFNSLEDLNGRVIGVVQNYAYGGDFYRAPGVVRIAANHVIQNLLRLSQGQIDATLGDVRALRFEINSYMRTNKDNFAILPKPLAVKGLHIAVSKQHPKHKEIAAAFDKAIEQMNAKGEIADIVKRHQDDHQWMPSVKSK